MNDSLTPAKRELDTSATNSIESASHHCCTHATNARTHAKQCNRLTMDPDIMREGDSPAPIAATAVGNEAAPADRSALPGEQAG